MGITISLPTKRGNTRHFLTDIKAEHLERFGHRNQNRILELPKSGGSIQRPSATARFQCPMRSNWPRGGYPHWRSPVFRIATATDSASHAPGDCTNVWPSWDTGYSPVERCVDRRLGMRLPFSVARISSSRLPIVAYAAKMDRRQGVYDS